MNFAAHPDHLDLAEAEIVVERLVDDKEFRAGFFETLRDNAEPRAKLFFADMLRAIALRVFGPIKLLEKWCLALDAEGDDLDYDDFLLKALLEPDSWLGVSCE